MLQAKSESQSLFSSEDASDNDYDMGASRRGLDEVCLCQTAPCTLYSEAHTPTPDRLPCEYCGRNRVTVTRSSEGYGTEEECVLSDPQGESDADADIEDTDCRLQEAGSLQRISARRRRRPRLVRQDTTESEDDGGRSRRAHCGNPKLSPHRAHSRTILEESVSQVRPLVICRRSMEVQTITLEASKGPKRPTFLWPLSLSLPLVLLVSLPLSLSLVVVVVSFLIPWTST